MKYNNPQRIAQLLTILEDIRKEEFQIGARVGIQSLEKVLVWLCPVGKEPPEGWKKYYRVTVKQWIEAEIARIKRVNDFTDL